MSPKRNKLKSRSLSYFRAVDKKTSTEKKSLFSKFSKKTKPRKIERRVVSRVSKPTTPSQSKKKSISQKSTVLILATLFMIFVAVFSYSTVTKMLSNIREFKVSDSLENKGNSPLHDNNHKITKTIYILSHKDQNSGVENVINIFITLQNQENGALMVANMPDWIYIDSFATDEVDAQSIRNLLYIGDSIYENSAGYTIGEISNTFGITFDNYIWINSDNRDFYDQITSTYEYQFYPDQFNEDSGEDFKRFFTILNRYSSFSRFNYLQNLDLITEPLNTNLTAVELHEHFDKLNSALSSRTIYFLDFNLDGAFEDNALETGKTVRQISPSFIDQYFIDHRTIMEDRDILREQSKVELLNGSGLAGAATRYSRRIKNSGLFVTRIDNSPEAFKKTTIFVSNPERFAYSIDIIKGLMPFDIEIVPGRPEFLTTGDIVVVLGEDLIQEFELSEKR